MDKQKILKLIAKKIEEHRGLDNAFHVGAREALRDLYAEISNR